MHVCDGQFLLLPPVRPLGERLGLEFFRAIPQTPGVYFLCSARDEILYVGKAKNLRRRLGSYRSANPERLSRKLRRLLVTVEHIRWDECESEAAALAREAELLLALRPRFNTAGVFLPPPHWLGWEATSNGLRIGTTPTRDDFPNLIGPIRSRHPVVGALLRLLWWSAHPQATAYELPKTLRDFQRPQEWRLPLPTQELGERLNRFFSGDDGTLPDVLLALAARPCPFLLRWHTEDAEVLRDHFERKLRA